MANLNPNLRGRKARILAVMFCVFIAAPMLGGLLHFETSSPYDIQHSEFRFRQNPDGLDTLLADPTRYAADLGQSFDDRLGFRRLLLKANRYIDIVIFDQSPTPGFAVMDKHHWAFLAQEVGYYQSSTPYTSYPLAEYSGQLEANRKKLAAMGIHYLVVIAPNKSTIYPEMLPDSVVRGSARKTDALYGYVRAHTQVTMVDLRPALLAAKSRRQLLYIPTDTHWNDLGALIAAQQIDAALKTWYPDIKIPQQADFTAHDEPLVGDLVRGAGDLLPSFYLRLVPKSPRETVVLPKSPEEAGDRGNFSLTSVIPGSKLPRAVVFRDSFMTALQPYLSEQFSRVVYRKSPGITELDMPEIQREHPNVVIVEVVERDLM